QVTVRSPCFAKGASGRWSAAASQISAKVHPGMSLRVSCGWCGGRKRRSDARRSVLPVLVSQLALVELAGGQPGQLVEELEALRNLVAGDVLAGERAQLALQLGAALDALGGLHGGHHRLAHLVVGDAEDGDVGDLRVHDEAVLDLLR